MEEVEVEAEAQVAPKTQGTARGLNGWQNCLLPLVFCCMKARNRRAADI